MSESPSSSPPEPRDDLVVWSESEPAVLDPTRLFDRNESDARDVELEVGFGKGRFLLAAARQWPERDFIGCDYARKLVRKVRDRVAREGLTNVRLYKGEARHLLGELLPEGSIARVHVYFPDPWPKRRHAKHRFFAPPGPDLVARVLRPGGSLLFATDHEPYAREVAARLRADPRFCGVLPEAFRDVPPSGFDAIFESRCVPTFRLAFERAASGPSSSRTAGKGDAV